MEKRHEIRLGARYMLNGDLIEVVSHYNGRYQLRGVDHKGVIYLPEGEVDKRLRQGFLVPVRSVILNEAEALKMVRLDASEQLKLDNHTFYVRRLHEKFHGSLPRKQTLNELQKLAAERGDPKPPRYTKLYKLMKRYVESGQNIFAILKSSEEKRFRAKRLCAESLDVMHDYIRNHYLKRNGLPAAGVYQLIKAHIEALNEERNLKLEIPSPATVYRAVNAIPAYDVDVARLGKKAAAKKHKFGKSIHCPRRLLARVEADTQEVDLELVDDFGFNIGRPHLTILIDTYTGALIGWCLSMTPPCYEKTASALRHALTEREDGSPAGLPEELVVDNGSEFYNASLLAAAQRLGMVIRFCSEGQPDQKSAIESFFKTLNVQLIHCIDGTTKSNPTAKGDYDSESEATLTLDELRNIFDDWVNNYYHERRHGQRSLPTIEMWKQSIDPISPPKVFSLEDVSFLCMATFRCKINKGRVRYNNLAWTGPSLSHLADIVGPGESVEVLYDRSDLGTAYVHAPGSNDFYPADAVSDYQYGLSMFEHLLVQEKLKEESKKYDEREARQALLRIHKEISNCKKRNQRRKRQQLQDLLARQSTVDFTNEFSPDENYELDSEENTSGLITQETRTETDDFAEDDYATTWMPKRKP
ncbi:Integrase core domain protein [compost metagenome]